MIDTHRKNHLIEREGVEIGSYFTKKTGRRKRYKRRKQMQTKKKDRMSLRFNPKKRQQQKQPYCQSRFTKGRPKEDFKETKGSNTAEPVQSMVEKLKKTHVSLVIVEDQHQQITLSSKKGGPILNRPSEEPTNELKRKGTRNRKGRKKKKRRGKKKKATIQSGGSITSIGQKIVLFQRGR